MIIDYRLISNVSLEDIDYSDAPDFCDAFVESADYNGEPMTEEMLDEINKDSSFVYERVINFIN